MRRNRVLRVLVLGVLSVSGAVALLDCDSGDGGGGGGSFDAGGNDTSFSSDGNNPGFDGALGDDGATDAGADTAPQYDDAGCPISTGALSPLADAGLPTSGLTLWLRADHGVAVATDGGVCRWDDQSGNGFSFKVTTGYSTPPSLEPTGLRNHPAVHFVGNQEMSRGDVLGLGGASGRTIAVYGAATDTTHRFHYFIQGNASTNSVYVGLDQNTFQTGGNVEGVYVANNAFDSNFATNGQPRSQVLTISSLAVGTPLPAGLVYHIDGQAALLSQTAGSGLAQDFSSANFTTVGALDMATEPFTGAFLGEVLIWNRALNDTEIAQVEAHFGTMFPLP